MVRISRAPHFYGFCRADFAAPRFAKVRFHDRANTRQVRGDAREILRMVRISGAPHFHGFRKACFAKRWFAMVRILRDEVNVLENGRTRGRCLFEDRNALITLSAEPDCRVKTRVERSENEGSRS